MVDLFAALRGMFKPILTNEAVALVFEEPTDVPRVFTDDKKLSQILRNFISNALKFTQSGEVRVSSQYRTPGWVTFSVADTGIGIAPEHQGALFQDFVQVDAPIQRRFRGTGLGLALSKRRGLNCSGGASPYQVNWDEGRLFSRSFRYTFLRTNCHHLKKFRWRPSPRIRLWLIEQPLELSS